MSFLSISCSCLSKSEHERKKERKKDYSVFKDTNIAKIGFKGRKSCQMV